MIFFNFSEPNLAFKSVASQSHVLWSYGPELANDGKHETCSYTTSNSDGRWWRMDLPSITSIGWAFDIFGIFQISLNLYCRKSWGCSNIHCRECCGQCCAWRPIKPMSSSTDHVKWQCHWWQASRVHRVSGNPWSRIDHHR